MSEFIHRKKKKRVLHQWSEFIHTKKKKTSSTTSLHYAWSVSGFAGEIVRIVGDRSRRDTGERKWPNGRTVGLLANGSCVAGLLRQETKEVSEVWGRWVRYETKLAQKFDVYFTGSKERKQHFFEFKQCEAMIGWNSKWLFDQIEGKSIKHRRVGW